MKNWKSWILLALIAALCLSLFGCGASKSEEEQKNVEKTLDVVDDANDYLDSVAAMDGYEYFIIKGDYDKKSDVYTVDVSFNTDAMREVAYKDTPAMRQSQYASIVEEFVDGFCKTLTDNVLDSLMNTQLKDHITDMFAKEDLDTTVVVQFTDPDGTTTKY